MAAVILKRSSSLSPATQTTRSRPSMTIGTASRSSRGTFASIKRFLYLLGSPEAERVETVTRAARPGP